MTASNGELVTTSPRFIRVRRRRLADHGRLHDCHEKHGQVPPTHSASFDLVRAVRIDGKPRHEFVLGLGSQKNVDYYNNGTMSFWMDALGKMQRHGLDVDERRRLANELSRKGARLPTMAHCERAQEWWRQYPSHLEAFINSQLERVNEIMSWLPPAPPEIAT
jgi:hypothetical protein